MPKFEIDILQHEISGNKPYWLSPKGKLGLPETMPIKAPTPEQLARLRGILKTRDAGPADEPRVQSGSTAGQWTKGGAQHVAVHVSKTTHKKGSATKVSVKASALGGNPQETEIEKSLKNNVDPAAHLGLSSQEKQIVRPVPYIPSKEEIAKVVAMSKEPLDKLKGMLKEFVENHQHVFFHGTSAQSAASILKCGLVPKGGPGGDVWALRQGVAGFENVKNESSGRKMSVFMTQDVFRACQYAQISADVTKSDPVILAVTVPDEHLKNITVDERDAPSGSLRFEGEIKPEWIAPVVLPLPKWLPSLKEQGFASNLRSANAHNARDAKSPTFYIVVLAKPDANAPAPTRDRKPTPAQLSIIKSLATRDDETFDPAKHPRGGHPENTGEFSVTSGGGTTTVKAPPGTTVKASTHHPHVTVEKNEKETPAPAQLSWEATPGATAANHMAAIHNAPIEQRREFHDAVEKVLTDADGNDLIAQAFGFDTLPTINGPGVFGGKVNPGSQAQANINQGIIPQPLSDEDKMKLNACEATRGMLLRQDAAAWHKPRFAPQGGAYLIPSLKFEGKVYSAGPTHRAAFLTMPQDVRERFVSSGEVKNDKNFLYRADNGKLLDRQTARQYADENGLLNDYGRDFKQPNLIAEHLDESVTCPERRLKSSDANLLDFRIGRTLTDQEAVQITQALSSLGGGFYSPITSAKGFRILNIPEATGIDNVTAKNQIIQALEAMESDTLGDIVLHAAQADTGYIENDWGKDKHGENYRETIASYQRPDLARAADAVCATFGPKVAAVEDEFAKRYGWQPDKDTRFWEKPAQESQVKTVNAAPGQHLHFGDSRYIVRDEFNPDEPRKPSGSGGGEWTKGGAGASGPTPAVRSMSPSLGDEFAKLHAAITKNDTPTPAVALLQKTLKAHPSASAKQIVEDAGLGAKLKIQMAESRTAASPSTDSPVERGGYKTREGFYTPAREQLHRKIVNDFLSDAAVTAATPAEGEKPTAVFLGGRGGSGKSWLTGAGHVVDKSKFITIDPDAVKEKLPGYQGWNAGLFHEESSDISQMIADRCTELGLNLIYDATMRTQASVDKKIDKLKKLGYDVEGYYMFASPETAARRAVDRFNSSGRYVPPEYVLSSTTNEQSFDGVKSKFKKWAVYDNDSPEFKPKLFASGGMDVAAA